jgi:hypothetical protein
MIQGTALPPESIPMVAAAIANPCGRKPFRHGAARAALAHGPRCTFCAAARTSSHALELLEVDLTTRAERIESELRCCPHVEWRNVRCLLSTASATTVTAFGSKNHQI